MKKVFIIIAMIFFAGSLLAQRPIINSLSKSSGTVNEVITINGSGFPTNIANIQVNFGAGIATVNTASANQIEVVVPSNATIAPVSVLDLATGLFGISRQQFTISFDGDGFDAGQVDAQANFNTANDETYDICLCDFDGDNKIDAALANRRTTEVSIFRNTSTVTTADFELTNIGIGITAINIDCGDLNGDGKPEIAVTNDLGSANDLVILRNTSTVGSIAMTSNINIGLPDLPNGDKNSARRVFLNDIDNDGKRDVIVGSAAETNLFIYLNTSTNGGNITLSAANEVPVSGASQQLGSLTIGDIDNDGLNDIVTFPFQITEDVYILKNRSQMGSVQFETPIELGISKSAREVTLSDLNQDRFLDIIMTDDAGRLIILPNTSSGGNISFGTQITKTAPNAWGIALGDFDGDGLIDVATGNTSGGIEVFINNSSGSISMNDGITISTTESVRNIDAGDLNGDGKPDFALTHKILFGQTDSDFTALINRNCFSPVISPTDLTFCNGSPFTVYATKAVGATYNWSIASGTGTITPNGDNADVTITSGASATVEVTIVATDGSCSGVGENTGQQVFTLTGGSPPAAPTIANSVVGTICSGEDFTLSGPASQTTYYWTLPDGTELEQSTNTLTISNASSSDAGVYSLRVQGAACVSDEGTINVAIDENPSISISNAGTDNFCSTGSTTLQVADYDGFTYQWQNSSGNISGANSSTYAATSTDTYTVQITGDVSGCVSFSNDYSVTAVPPPSSSFDTDAEICVNTALDLLATSTGESGYTLTYDWDFGDGTTMQSTTSDMTHTYATAGDYTITLTTGYANVDVCTDVETFDVTVSDPSAITILTPEGIEKCPGDSIRLELPQNFQSYSWSTGDDTYFTYAKTRNTEDDVTISVDMVTNIGCDVTSDQVVSNYANSRVNITSPDASIVNDTISLDENTSSITLFAENGSGYTWTPAEILDNTNSESVVASPQAEFTKIYVTGTDPVNSCVTTDSIVIQTPGVIARKSFSPNGDMMGYDCWEILNTNNLEGCTVYIMDERGRYVFKGNSPFTNNCVWNGNLDNGTSQAPEGIYYFVLKCENESFSQTGSILLGR